MDGWIKIYRDILNHWIYQDSKYFHAWCIILLTVNHQYKKTMIHGELIECDRGQSILSLNGWVDKFGSGWTIKKVRTFFDLLKNDSMITTEGLKKTTRLTVCNYGKYQDQGQTEGRQRADRGQTEGRQRATNKKEKNEKNDKNNTPLPPLHQNLVFPFSSIEFMKSWNEWMQQPKQKNKPISAHQKNLDKLSKFNELYAIELLDIAIAGNYQGCIFTGTKIKYSEWLKQNENNGRPFSKKMSFNDLQNLPTNGEIKF